MIGVTITKRGDTYSLAGSIDETVDFSPVLALLDRPLRLNWRGIKSINSLGMALLIKFSEKLGDRQVELHDLSPVLVEAVNIAPLVIGGQSKIHRIKSVWAPLICPGKHTYSHSIKVEDLVVNGDTVALPYYQCPKCSLDLTLDGTDDPSDFFFFLIVSQD